jgi:hypothetical protein
LFAVAFFAAYWMGHYGWLRLGLLLAGCFTFYAHFAGAAGMLPIIFLASATYVAGLSRGKWILQGAMALSIVALVFYKYRIS